MRPAVRALALWAFAGHAHALVGVRRSDDIGAGAESRAGFVRRKSAAEFQGGHGLVGGFGKRGFRMLGGSCWDSAVWRSDFGRFDFHLTRAMCAKTRLHRSYQRSAETVLRKLHEGKCINAMAIGASMTFGNCYGCWHSHLPEQYDRAWTGQLKKWLDLMFPCDEEKGHTVSNYAQSAADANYWSMMTHVWKANKSHEIHKADIIFMDSAVTDVESRLGAAPPMLLMPPQNADLVTKDNELLVRVLKSLPSKPWLINAEVSFRIDKERYKGDVHWDGILTHLPVFQHYDVDQVSLLDAFLPLTSDKLNWLRAYFFVDGAHGSPFGHQMIAQIIAHTLMEESHHLNGLPSEEEPREDEGLADPVWMHPDLAKMYDFVAPYELIPFEEPFKHVFAWQYFAWNGHQLVATDLPGDAYPTINFWVNMSLNETENTRPFQYGYVNLGLRRLKQRGLAEMYYHVMESPCGPPDSNSTFRTGLSINPYWPIPSSLRYNEGFWFELPNATIAPVACLIMILQWQGQPGTDPWQFLIDDLTVLA